MTIQLLFSISRGCRKVGMTSANPTKSIGQADAGAFGLTLRNNHFVQEDTSAHLWEVADV